MKSISDEIPTELNGFDKYIKQIVIEIENILKSSNNASKHTKLLNQKYGNKSLRKEKDRDQLNSLTSPRKSLNMSYNETGSKFINQNTEQGLDLTIESEILSPRTKLKQGLLP